MESTLDWVPQTTNTPSLPALEAESETQVPRAGSSRGLSPGLEDGRLLPVPSDRCSCFSVSGSYSLFMRNPGLLDQGHPEDSILPLSPLSRPYQHKQPHSEILGEDLNVYILWEDTVQPIVPLND